MADPHLRVEARGIVTLVTLDRPPANALNHALLRELKALLPRLEQARAVVLTGTGRFFSAGLDLLEVLSYEEPEATAFAETFDDAMTGLFALGTPVVAAVNGHAIAGGCVLAAAADFRLVAAGEARLGLSEIQVGVPFPTSAFEIVRLGCAGPHLSTVLLRGLTYGPPEAVAMNMADELVPAAELLDRALALAEELGARPPVAFSTSKQRLRAEALARMAAARRAGPDPIWDNWRSDEVRAAVAAYRQRTLGKR